MNHLAGNASGTMDKLSFICHFNQWTKREKCYIILNEVFTICLFQFERIRWKLVRIRGFFIPCDITQKSHVIIIFVLLWLIPKRLKTSGIPAVDCQSLQWQSDMATKALTIQSPAFVLRSSSDLSLWPWGTIFRHSLKSRSCQQNAPG